MDNNQFCIDKLPDEILLSIFRNVPPKVFITVLPFVCKRWRLIIESDTHTMKRIGMIHCNSCTLPVVEYFYTETAFDIFLHLSTSDIVDLLRYSHSNIKPHDYLEAVYSCVQYSDTIYKHITVLEIEGSLRPYLTAGFTYLESLTTLIFCNVNFKPQNTITFLELSSVYPNLQNIAYIECGFSVLIDMTYLHYYFKHLKQFRLDHNVASDRFLENLLNTNHDLETIIFRNCVVTGDRWLNVLLDKLKGRTITSLSIHSPYFTSKGINEFLNTDILKLDKTKVNISDDKTGSVPFYINFV